jgi:hypothetical protein
MGCRRIIHITLKETTLKIDVFTYVKVAGYTNTFTRKYLMTNAKAPAGVQQALSEEGTTSTDVTYRDGVLSDPTPEDDVSHVVIAERSPVW